MRTAAGQTLLVLAVSLCVLPLGILGQETCAAASRIYETRTNTGTIVPPTTDASIDFGLCGADLDASVGDRMFRFSPGEQGTYTVNACSNNADFSLSVSSGTCDALTCLTPTETCEVTFTAVPGETYYFLLHAGSTLNYALTFSYDLTTHPCESATSISLGATTVDPPAIPSYLFARKSCGSSVSLSLGFAYYRFLVPETGRYKMETESGNVLTYKGSCGNTSCFVGSACLPGVVPPSCSSTTRSKEVILEAEAGENLLVVIRGIRTTESFEVKVSAYDIDVTPCLDQTDVFLDTPLVSSAVGSPSNFASCGTIHDTDASDVFFRFVAPKEGLYSVDTCGSTDTSFTSSISVYTSSCEAPQCSSGNGGFCGSHSLSQFTAEAEGTEFLIMVHSYGSTLGDFTLNLTYNFGCADATELGVGTNTTGTTLDNGYPSSFPNCGTRNYDGRDVLYTFTPPEKGYYQINTCTNVTGNDTQLSVYRGTCDAYSCEAGNDDFCGLYSSVDFLGEAGEQFLVMVHGYAGRDVSFEVHTEKLQREQLTCEDAYPILLDEPVNGDTGLGFFSDIPECGVTNDPWSPEVFYKFIAPAAGSYQADTCGTKSTEPTDTKISVYSGGCDELVCVDGNDDGGEDCGGFRSLVKFDAVEAGQEFLIMVHAFRRNSGPFQLSITGTKDLCSVGREITLGPYIVGNTTSDGISNDLPACGVSNRNAPDTFFRFVAPKDSIYTVDTCGLDTRTDTKVSIYAFCGTVCLNGNDDSGCGYFKSRASFLAAKGSEYLIRVEPYSDRSGGEFSIEVYESMPNVTYGAIEDAQESDNRPQLLDSSLHIREAQVMNHRFEYAQATLDFDQKIYLNEPLMCPFAEWGCDPLPGACEDCNWEDVSAGCWGSNCCSEPCEVEDEGFIEVPLNGESDLILLNSSDSQYFRFVLDNVSACGPIQVSVNTEYGNTRLLVSNVKGFPEWSDRLNSNGEPVLGYISSDPTYHYSQASLTLCPAPLFAQGYDHAPGIYSVGVFALENTAFRLEISVGMRHPIPQPAKRVSCQDVPEIELQVARGKEGSIHDVLCIEDSVTEIVHLDYPVVDLSNQVILPFPAGCHVATFTATGFLYGGRNEYEPADVYCFPTVENDIVKINTSTIGRRKKDRDADAITFTACSDEPFFVHCSYHFWKTEYYTLLFSSTVVPKRTPLIDVRPGPLAMSRGIGAVAATLQGKPHNPCVDWQKNCDEFLTPSITDPQPLWPPPGDMWIVKGHFDFPLPPDRMIELNLAHKIENRVTFIKHLSKANNQLITSNQLLDYGSLSIIALTNENGDPLMLPNDGKRNKNGKRQESGEQPQSFLDYVPNIAYSSLEVGFFPVCDLEKYEIHQAEVEKEISNLLPATTFDDVIPSQYIIEVLNDAYARTSCVAAAADFLDFERSLTVIRGQTGCQYPIDSPMWAEDPCCNPAAVPLACCAPYSDTREEYVYAEADPKELEECGVYDCAESYLNDLADTLNTFTDPITGCASGVLRPEEEMRSVIDEQLDKTLRECAGEVGFGDPFRSGFTGVKCAEDSDCPSNICNRQLGTCALPSYQETEDSFLNCFITRMSSLTEDYLRENVFPQRKEFEIISRESPEFLAAVRDAATHTDCVNTENALDFSQMTHKKLSVPSRCARDYVSNLSPYNDDDLVDKFCPTQYCLGDICRFDSHNCYEGCAEFSDYVSSEASCEEANLQLTTSTCGIEGVACDGTFSCVFCPEDGSACEVVEKVVSQDECENMFMCVLPNGTQFVTDSEGDCQSHYECSVDCAGAQCRGKAPGRGACLYTRPQGVSYGDCVAKGGVNTNLLSEPKPVCVMKDISTQQDCLTDPDFVWDTCESLDVDECTYENFSPGQVFLGCGVDIFQTCESKEECEASGRCSDLDLLRQTASESFDAEDPTPSKETRALRSGSSKARQAKGEAVQNGACLTSGTHLVTSISSSRIPYCALGKESAIGCIEDVEEEFCDGPVEYFGSFKRWRTWVTPALSEEVCLGSSFGHSGCQLPGETFHQWGWNSSDCDCRLGSYGNTWTWTPGQWVTGEVRPLKWMAAEYKSPVYEYRETINFWTLAEWVEKSSVTQFTDSVKSQIICEANLMTSSLETILCDCVDTDESGSSCYGESTTSIEVGIRDVCEGEVSILKGPSNNIMFDETAVKERCTEVKLGMLRKSAFAVSRETASVSFQFEQPEKPGVVLNEKGATVGELFGDGAVLSFEKPTIVRHFRACLRVTVDQKAKVRDFGYTTGTTITPLGLNDVEVKEESLIEFWCATLDKHEIPTDSDDSIKIFPISLDSSDWEDEDDQDYSDSTIALVYTLGGLYIADFLLLSFFLIHLFYQVSKRSKKVVPVVAWIGMLLAVLCVFRIVFCFLWPVDGFGDNSLAEYVVFEIPTFLLFSIVILSISFFRKLSRTGTFFVKENDKTLTIATAAAIFLVWCLFAVVAIVYAEVILEDNEATSECPGRVEAESDIDEQTRTLSIVYQSIVIVFTFILAIAFFYSSWCLFKLTQKQTQASSFVFRLGAILVTAFVVRCILFMILLALDFTSAVYLFCTLLFTEVLMIFLIQLEFNKHFYNKVVTTMSSRVGSGSNSRTTQNGKSTAYDMDD